MSYSQGPEEAHILNFFGDKVGTFLDIGANDGKTFSNTHALALNGWGGLCVDASPVAFASLQRTYPEPSKVQCLYGAVTNADGPITFHQASDTLVSSLSSQQPEIWKAFNFSWDTVEVPGMTFATMMNKSRFKTFDFISIDAEGSDIAILQQMNLEALGCKLLCIEHDNRQAEILRMCNGWRIVYGGDINLILAR